MTRVANLPKFTVPSMSLEDGATVARVLQERLNALNDLALTLKHIHWNVVGPRRRGVPHARPVRKNRAQPHRRDSGGGGIQGDG